MLYDLGSGMSHESCGDAGGTENSSVFVFADLQPAKCVFRVRIDLANFPFTILLLHARAMTMHV